MGTGRKLPQTVPLPRWQEPIDTKVGNPDGTFHKSRADGSERKELRIWLPPLLVGGVRVWLGQVSYEMGGKGAVALEDAYQFDPDLDDARMFLMQNFWYSQSLAGIAFVGEAPGQLLTHRSSTFMAMSISLMASASCCSYLRVPWL